MNELKISYESSVIEMAREKFTDLYCQSHAYNSESIGYREQICKDKNVKYEHKSFVILDNDKPVILFQGIKIYNDKTDFNSFEGWPCIFIENNTLVNKNNTKAFINEINKIIKNCNGQLWYRDFLFNGNLSSLSKFLLRNGGESKQFYTNVIDLNLDESALKINLRKSYKSLINWGLNKLSPTIYNHKNIKIEHIDSFRELHKNAAGRETRSRESWIKQYEMIMDSKAFIVIGNYNNEMVTAGLFMHDSNVCYYGVSASKRDLFDKPLFHSLMWKSILYSKKN